MYLEETHTITRRAYKFLADSVLVKIKQFKRRTPLLQDGSVNC